MKTFDRGIWIDGGLGKVIASSACMSRVCGSTGNRIVVVSGYPEVFMDNPWVYRTIGFNQTPYIWEDYLDGIPVIKQDPYLIDDYRLNKKHLIECFCKIYGIEYDSTMKPHLFLTEQEENEIRVHKERGEFQGKYIVLHIQGGTTYLNPNGALNKLTKSRDWPTNLAQKFVDLFKSKYPNIKIIQIGLPTEPILHGVISKVGLPARLIFPIVKYCDSFVCIDGFINHISASFDKKGVVLWGGTDPKRLGYAQNINLVPDDSACKFCHITDYAGHLGGQFNCKYNYSCMNHNPEFVLESISQIMK